MEKIDEIKQLKADYNIIFTGEVGTRVLNNLEIICGVKQCSFDKTNSHTTAFNEGQRSVFLHIQETMNMDLTKLERSFDNG